VAAGGAGPPSDAADITPIRRTIHHPLPSATIVFPIRLFAMLNPIHHGSEPEAIERYKVEPYAMCADIYAAPPHTSRGGWTWYTGAAGWMYRLTVEALLGLQLEVDHLRIAPCIPAHWESYTIHYRYRETVYHITVKHVAEQPEGASQFDLSRHDLHVAPLVWVVNSAAAIRSLTAMKLFGLTEIESMLHCTRNLANSRWSLGAWPHKPILAPARSAASNVVAAVLLRLAVSRLGRVAGRREREPLGRHAGCGKDARRPERGAPDRVSPPAAGVHHQRVDGRPERRRSCAGTRHVGSGFANVGRAIRRTSRER
jgi:hypothetical protein